MNSSRQEKLLYCITPAIQIGVEIGPLTAPVVTRDMGFIRYVDHITTEDLKLKYADFRDVDTSKIVDVDYVLGDQNLSILLSPEAPFDYFVASHVVEHVPDLVGWFREIHAVLKPGGVLSLAIPDKQYCLDYYRTSTKPAEVIEAYLQQSQRPSPRQIFDHFSSAVSLHDNIGWGCPIDDTELSLCHSMVEAFETTAEVYYNSSYCDVHCWVFTPASFFNLLKVLTELNLVEFKVKQFFETEGCEFFVILEAIDTALEVTQRRTIQLDSLTELKLLSIIDRNDPIQNSKLLKFKESQLLKLEEEAEALRIILEQKQSWINAMESSKFWKIRQAWFRFKSLLGIGKLK